VRAAEKMELVGVDKKSDKEAENLLKQFSLKNVQATKFEMKLEDRKRVWKDVFSVLDRSELVLLQFEALNCARILSRDKSGLNETISEEMIHTLMKLGDIEAQNVSEESASKVVLESLKVFSNLLHQSCVVQSYCTKNGFLSKILTKVTNHSKSGKQNKQSQIFDFRLLFLFTALCPEQRDVAKYNHEGLKVLREALEDILSEKSEMEEPYLAEEDCSVICEILKVVFNLTVETKTDETKDLILVAATLNRVLRINTNTKDFDLQLKVVNNCINVITNMEGKVDAFKALLEPSDILLPAEPDVRYEGSVINTIQSFLDFLTHKIDNTLPGSTLKEDITPCLSVLWNISRSLRLVRKFLKSVILPPLTATDIKEKPEEGNSLKAKLVSLLTNTNGDISTMVAELLFVLCKENVGRLIKHTGYGNAAGLLARRGLMAGGKGAGDFSEDEESDTEEYLRERHKINPVIGCVEEPVVSPLEGMSEEQKEYEAMQLVNLMDKMQRTGLISPCRVGEDGRPEAVEHVMQLIEGQKEKEQEDSD